MKNAIIKILFGLAIFLCTKSDILAQVGCNFEVGDDITFTVTGGTGTNQYFILTNIAGIIQYSSTTLPISGVVEGQYLAYSLEYENTGTAPDLSVGQDINNLSGTACVDISTALPVGVCACSNTTGTLSFTISGTTSGANFTEVFALTDSAGTIISTHTSSPIAGLNEGIYNIYSIVYDHTDTPPTLTAGTGILAIGGACVDISMPLGFVVCLDCPEINNLITNRILCSGEQIDTLAVTTTFTNPDSIAFVYFSNAQSDPSVIYTSGIGIDTIQVAASNDTLRIINVSVAAFVNVGVNPDTFYIYAIANPVPSNTTCRPYAEILVIVNPQPNITAIDAAICNGQTLDLNTLITGTALSSLEYGTTFGTYGASNSVTPNTTTTYFVRDSVDATGCVDTSSLMVSIVPCDLGDLPDTSITTNINDYQTLIANNGPVHQIIPGLHLGSTVDGESDGQPSTDALGDGADEDGIMAFANLDLVPGGNFRLPFSYVNTTGDTAHVEAWIDWNGDGDFDDASEMVADWDDADAALPDRMEISIPNNVLLNQNLGWRIRISNQDNMTPYGAQPNGEIEDYLIQLGDCPQICLPINGTVTTN